MFRQIPSIQRRILTDHWPGFSGSVIQLSSDDRGNFRKIRCGERDCAGVSGSLAFARRVIAEGIEPASDFPSGSFPNDKLTYKGNRIVEYGRTANQDGLGTASRLKKNDFPIDGVLVLSGQESELELSSLSMRLPSNAAGLTKAILAQVEREASQP